MFRKILCLVLLVFVIACKKNTLPPECVFEEFHNDSKDYRTYMDALDQYLQSQYNCYKDHAFEMLQTPEKQALYEPAIVGYRRIGSFFSYTNKFTTPPYGDRTAIAIYAPSRLTIQEQVDDFLRSRKTPIDENKIPQKCRSFATSAERNVCYEELLKEYTEKYIFDGYAYIFDDNVNYKPDFTETLNKGLTAIKALYQAASDDQAFIDDQLEAYYLELIHCLQEILKYEEKSLSFE